MTICLPIEMFSKSNTPLVVVGKKYCILKSYLTSEKLGIVGGTNITNHLTLAEVLDSGGINYESRFTVTNGQYCDVRRERYSKVVGHTHKRVTFDAVTKLDNWDAPFVEEDIISKVEPCTTEEDYCPHCSGEVWDSECTECGYVKINKEGEHNGR